MRRRPIVGSERLVGSRVTAALFVGLLVALGFVVWVILTVSHALTPPG